MRRVPTDPRHRKSDDDATPRREPRQRQALAYQGAFEAVASIMVGGAMGYFVDEFFDSSPLFLLVGFAFGFSAFFVRLVRLKRALESAEQPPD